MNTQPIKNDGISPWPWKVLRLGLFMLAITSGCSAPTRMTHLRDTLRDFSQQVRWGMMGRASQFVDVKARSQWLAERMGALQSIRVTDVQLAGIDSAGPRARKARVFFTITYYGLTTNTVKRSVWEQNWEHRDKIGWLLMDEKPAELPKVEPTPTKGAWP
ncbi:MAG: hypothetical protein VX589_19005 [Myxococcota bacterium]|nr:hypothetical protein [Myxococcota bacterium]